MRLSTVSRAPGEIGANDAEAPEASILPCVTRAQASGDAQRAAWFLRLRERSVVARVHATVTGRTDPFALWMSSR
jgi:hypothetical protein